jgi:hypothetical protein
VQPPCEQSLQRSRREAQGGVRALKKIATKNTKDHKKPKTDCFSFHAFRVFLWQVLGEYRQSLHQLERQKGRTRVHHQADLAGRAGAWLKSSASRSVERHGRTIGVLNVGPVFNRLNQRPVENRPHT